MIFDPAPEARVTALRDALAPVADALREMGATVEMTACASSGLHSVILTANHHCPIADAEIMARALEYVAGQSEGEAYCTLHSRLPAGLLAGEHGFTLRYHVTKPRPA